MILSRKISVANGASVEYRLDSAEPRLKILRSLFDENAYSYFCDYAGSNDECYTVPTGMKLVIFGISFYVYQVDDPFPDPPTVVPLLSYFGYANRPGSLDCVEIIGDFTPFYSDTVNNASSPMFLRPIISKPSLDNTSEPYYAEIPGEASPAAAVGALPSGILGPLKMVCEIYGMEIQE